MGVKLHLLGCHAFVGVPSHPRIITFASFAVASSISRAHSPRQQHLNAAALLGESSPDRAAAASPVNVVREGPERRARPEIPDAEVPLSKLYLDEECVWYTPL
jgi:hypothetical protein